MEPTEADLQAFFDSMVEKQRFAENHIRHVRVVWANLKAKLPELSLPCCAPAEDDAMELYWANRHIHVDIDVYPDGECDWFARDRIADYFESGACGPEVPQKLLAWFRKLLAWENQ